MREYPQKKAFRQKSESLFMALFFRCRAAILGHLVELFLIKILDDGKIADWAFPTVLGDLTLFQCHVLVVHIKLERVLQKLIDLFVDDFEVFAQDDVFASIVRKRHHFKKSHGCTFFRL